MPKKAVVVDDTMFMRMTLKSILENLGYEVIGEGADGFDAVRLYKQLEPDLITMDITMPNKDGIAAVKEILAINTEAKVIMVSAMGQKTRVIDAITAGAKDFVVKPFKQERIAEALGRIEIAEKEQSKNKGKSKKTRKKK